MTEVDQRAKEAEGENWFRCRWRLSREAVEMMDKTIIDGINATVGEEDILWMLGDFAFGIREEYYHRCRAYRDRINCRNISIVWGNHDRSDIKYLFSYYCDLATIPIPDRKARMVMCHYAMAIWEGSHRGNIQLYGHSHSRAEAALDQMMPGRRSMDVGVDNAAVLVGAFRPFSLEEILGFLDTKPGNAIDYHSDD